MMAPLLGPSTSQLQSPVVPQEGGHLPIIEDGPETRISE